MTSIAQANTSAFIHILENKKKKQKEKRLWVSLDSGELAEKFAQFQPATYVKKVHSN